MSPSDHNTPDAYIRRADDLAGLVRSRREAMGMSQQVLANKLGVSRKWVNEIEQGNSNAKLGLVLRAVNELGIDLVARSQGVSGRRPISTPLVDEIDIDQIADTGLIRGRR